MPAAEITLRPIREDDEQFLRLVYAETRREELAQVQWPEGAQEAFLRMQFDLQAKHYFTHYASAQFLVIEASGQPIGRLYIDHAPEEIRIIDIAIIPQARNQGIGGSLLNNIIAQSQNRRVSIHVEKQNRALAFYQRLGFKIVDDRGVYWYLERKPDLS